MVLTCMVKFDRGYQLYLLFKNFLLFLEIIFLFFQRLRNLLLQLSLPILQYLPNLVIDRTQNLSIFVSLLMHIIKMAINGQPQVFKLGFIFLTNQYLIAEFYLLNFSALLSCYDFMVFMIIRQNAINTDQFLI